MRLENLPELLDGIKPATSKKLDALHREIKELIESETDHAQAVQELKSADGIPSTSDRDRLQDERYKILQRRLELCERLVEFSLDVANETHDLSKALPTRGDLMDQVCDQLRTVGYDFYRADIYWRDRAGRFLNVEGLVGVHPTIIEHERQVDEIRSSADDWRRYNGDVFRERDAAAKTADKIREEALAAV